MRLSQKQRIVWLRHLWSCHAYGIAAVISHAFPDGTERPVAFASCTLTAKERNYAQIQKETLSLIYDVQKIPLWRTFHAGYRP